MRRRGGRAGRADDGVSVWGRRPELGRAVVGERADHAELLRAVHLAVLGDAASDSGEV